jgi:uncharacterized repeat protein (TIGR03803 family)
MFAIASKNPGWRVAREVLKERRAMGYRNLPLQTIFLICAMASILLPTPSSAEQFTILHNFTCTGTDGCLPNGGLVFDSKGNLYGTTQTGGQNTTCVNGCGTVFELTPKKGGGWSEKVLHNFGANKTDGTTPMAGLIMDSAGNLYGTTESGGTYGEGTVFELSLKPGSTWKETVLHSFDGNGTDGDYPQAGLARDGAGNLYGIAGGGRYNHGVIFELTPGSGGNWTETILCSFLGRPDAGVPESAGLTLDATGAIYGTTFYGGSSDGCSQNNAGFGCGAVFNLTPSGSGDWTESVLYSFWWLSTDDGYYPNAAMVFDSAGNLLGTTAYGGDVATCQYFQIGTGCGTAFELSPSNGSWTETILHNFGLSNTDGTLPSSGLILDKSGNLYGVTQSTGANYAAGYGTVFELSPKAGGRWSEKILHSFASCKQGCEPTGNLTIDSSGNLYGAAGVIFEITP